MALPELQSRIDPNAAERLHATIEQHRDEQPGVEWLGLRTTDENEFAVRFLAVRATEWIEVQLQHDGAGGGGVDYNDTTFVSRTLVDCRENRLQEMTIETDGINEYKVFLIPVLMED